MPEPPAAARRHPKVVVRNLLEEQETSSQLARDARAGLTSNPKTMPPKYFYDARGSELFERITGLEEYYQTRTERGILERIAPVVVDRIRPTVLVEFGPGSAFKTRVLLEEMRRAGRLAGYGMLDVSESASRGAAAALVRDFPTLPIECVITDFERTQPLPFSGHRRLLAFLGSTIGNLEAEAASGFLREVARRMHGEDAFLIGFDLVKDTDRLLRAYDDDEGVTAAFNLNLLRVLNRELDADFDLDAFRHHVTYDERNARIEMHLVSRRDQSVRLRALDLEIEFAAGESLRTELSHKYTRRSVEALMEEAEMALDLWEMDPDGLFALALGRRR